MLVHRPFGVFSDAADFAEAELILYKLCQLEIEILDNSNNTTERLKNSNSVNIRTKISTLHRKIKTYGFYKINQERIDFDAADFWRSRVDPSKIFITYLVQLIIDKSNNTSESK